MTVSQKSPYQQALDYLYSFVDYSVQRMSRETLDKFDLSRMQAFMAALGDPQKQYSIIHVAGTKGKGSTAALCASTLQAAGLRTGFYTSPHLQEFTERIQIDGAPIAPETLVSLIEEMKPVVASIPYLTTFEITTALAFCYFARQKAEAAVIEVGLGGRLDATNVVVPCVSVITSISYDHVAVLGETLSQIAAEKCGIIKHGVPVVTSPQKDEALAVIARMAAERQAPLVKVGSDWRYALREHTLDGQSFWIWAADDQPAVNTYIESDGQAGHAPRQLTIPLLGYHQIENAATAYAALQTGRLAGLPLTDESIQSGFASVVWPGRFEVLQREPPVVVDSAHNRDSALKLRLALGDYFLERPVVLLFGASADKDVRGMFAELLPRVRRVIATESFHPRAMSASELVDMAHQFACPAKVVTPVEDALREALRLAEQEGAMVLATGSLFIAAAVREVWRRYER